MAAVLFLTNTSDRQIGPVDLKISLLFKELSGGDRVIG